MLHFLLSFFHVIVCALLVFIILIQSNKGMGLSGAFGAVGAGDNFFSASSAFNILVKITVTLAILFAMSSLALSYFPPPASQTTGSVIEQHIDEVPQPLSAKLQEAELPEEGAAEAPAGGAQPGEIPAAGGMQPGEPAAGGGVQPAPGEAPQGGE